MGVVDLGEQRASRQILGNVRMGTVPDLSAQWRGLKSIGEGISDLSLAIPRAISTIDAVFERNAQNEANKLYSEYLTHMEESLNSPGDPNNPDGAKGLFVRAEEDDEAAQFLNDNIKTAREQILETIGYNDASKRTKEIFQLKAQSYDLSTNRKANSIMTARFAFSEKANAKLALDASTRVALGTPTMENFNACGESFLSFARANGYTDEQTLDGMRSLNRNIAIGMLAEKAAAAQTPEEVQQIVEGIKKGDVRFLGGDNAEVAEFLQTGFERTLPTERKALMGKLASREATVKDNQDRVYRDSVLECRMKARNGEMTSTQIGEKVEEWKSAGAPIQYINSLDELRGATWSSETGQTINKLAGQAVDLESGEATLKALDAMTEQEKAHPYWAKAYNSVQAGLGKAFFAQQQEECDVRLNMARYNNGEYLLTVDERKRIIDNPSTDPTQQGLLQRGFLTPEQAEKELKQIDAQQDERIQPLLQEVFSNFSAFAQATGQVGKDMVPEVADVRWKLKGTSVDINATISGYRTYSKSSLTETEKRNIAVLGGQLQKAVDNVVEYAATHPEATAQQCKDFFGNIIYPILPDLTAYKIAQMTPRTIEFAQAKMWALDTVRFADAPRAAIEERSRYNPGESEAFFIPGTGRQPQKNPTYSGTPAQRRVQARSQKALQKQRDAEGKAKAKTEEPKPDAKQPAGKQ